MASGPSFQIRAGDDGATDETVLVMVRVPATPGVGTADAADLAAAALWAEGATALEIQEGPEGTTLLAGYPTPRAAHTVARRLGSSLGARVQTVTDTTWRDAWRAWVHPVPVGRGLMVVPSWRDVPVDSGRLTIEIDPGTCFGSGTHASTRMLLAWMDRHPPVGAEVLDVGTGSGILAVAAARLGARRVTGLDIDPAAVEVTRANAARNGVAALIEVATTAVEEVPGGCADLVMVNVTAGTHAAIGPHSARAVRAGGTLLAAGLLPGQWEHVAGAYAELILVEQLGLDGWEGAVLQRTGTGAGG